MQQDLRMPLDEVSRLVRRGRFAEARAALHKVDCSSQQKYFPYYQALLSDVLQRTGSNNEAESMASQFLKSSPKTEVSGRFHYVLGNVYRERGQLARAVSEFQAAAQLSETDLELFCWVQLRLMCSIGDIAGTQTAMARMGATRDALVRFGDKRPFSALHLWIAESETVRGRLDAARHHLRIAESLLSEVDDVWLKGYLAINSFGVCYYAGDIVEAEKWSTLALECSAESGHKGARRAAYANAGSIEFSLGRLEKAEHLLRLALAECETGSTNHVAVLHSLALVKLQRNDIEGCKEIVEIVDNLSDPAESKSAYYRAWTIQTKIQFLLRQGRIHEAKQLCANVHSIFEKLTTPRVSTGLHLLTAETLVASGDLGAAADRLVSLLSNSPGLPPDLLADTERVLATTLYQAGSTTCARISAARAIEIFQVLGHAVGEDHVTSETCQFATDLKALTNVEITRGCVDRVRALLDTRKRPEIFGREAVHLLSDLDCADSIALTAINHVGRRELLCRVGGEVRKEAAELLIIEIGNASQGQLRLELIPKPEPAAILTTGNFERVIKGIATANAIDTPLADSETVWPSDEWLSNRAVVFAAKPMMELLKTIKKISATDISVLITGETGTGKEIIAKVIHERSHRATKPFVAFNCAAVPKDLIESQLFGYKRGAFSGANDGFLGVIRAANGGTLLLDEIGEIPLEIQPKLLRFIDSGEVHPLGEARPIPVNVRLLFATNVDLENAVKQGRFREDLFFRINVIPLKVPPLRDRREEIPLLVNFFANRFSRELSKEAPKFTSESMEALVLYPWPGNVRQLSNEIRRLIAIVDDGIVITPAFLSSHISKVIPKPRSRNSDLPCVTLELDQGLNDAVSTLERTMVEHALMKSRGHVTEAARILGLSRKGLYLKRQRLGLIDFDGTRRTNFDS